MYKLEAALLALDCLAFAGRGWQMQTPSAKLSSRGRPPDDSSELNPLHALSLSLFAFSPAAAFSSAGLHSHAGKPMVSIADALQSAILHRCLGPSVPVMSISDKWSPAANPFKEDGLHIHELAHGFLPTTMQLPALPSVANKLLKYTLAAILGVLLMGSPHQMLADENVPAQGSQVMREVVDLLDKYYLDRTFNGVDLKKVRQELDSGNAMLDQDALDKSVKLIQSLGDGYTRILPPGEFKRSPLAKMDRTGVGINFVQSENGDFLVGQVPEKTTDAAKKDIRYGEVVTAINGKPIRGLKSLDVIDLIDKSGDTFTVTVRPATGPVVTMVEREIALSRSVPKPDNPLQYKMYDANDGSGKIGYVKLMQFPIQTKERVQEAFRTLEASGASQYVLDLRNSRGGLTSSAFSTASLFMKQPLVARVSDKANVKTPIFWPEEDVITSRPMQVWIDTRTADSSELLAGALRDNCRATIVGTKTYGKGVAQGYFGLSDGAVLVESFASWSTPAGKEVSREGIMPDIERKFSSDFSPKFLDQDLKAASQDFATDTLKGCRPPAEPLLKEIAADVQQKLLTAQR
mmetsp:Transcript_28745/g.50106  ORF Transcript_28745/g.50106 Transcript_28745/m.50106 type:complete len:576 (+) Transcript_28745:74-1801(+)